MSDEKLKVVEFPSGLKTVKIGNVDFRVDNFKPKTKAEFIKKYAEKEDHNFNRDEAWEFLKQFVQKETK